MFFRYADQHPDNLSPLVELLNFKISDPTGTPVFQKNKIEKRESLIFILYLRWWISLDPAPKSNKYKIYSYI